MPAPKTFLPGLAEAGHFVVDPQHPTQVVLYRFGDQATPANWQSSARRAANGNFAAPRPTDLNDWALKQTSYGSKMEGAAGNPFLSVATDYSELFQNGEGWVQQILRNVPTLGVFSVPFTQVYRPSPTKSISKMETEWLVLDDIAPLSSWRVEWRANPYLPPPA